MNKLLNNSINKTGNAVQLSPLIVEPLLKNTISSNLTDYSLESILKSHNTIDTKKVISKKQFKNNIKTIVEKNNNLIENFNSTMITKFQNILNLKKLGVSPESINRNLNQNLSLSLNTNNKNSNKTIEFQLNKKRAIEHNNNIFNYSYNNTSAYATNLSDTKITEKSFILNKSKYIKSISLFNSDVAGYNTIVYSFNKKNNPRSEKIKNIYSILESSFLAMSSLISKPVFFITPIKIKIQLFFYWYPLKKKYKKSNFFSKFLILNQNKLEYLVNNLSKLINKPVELELIRLYYPHYDSNILANLIGLISNIIKFRFIKKRLFMVAKIKNPTRMTKKISNTIIPSFISGLKLKLAGRILTQRTKLRVKAKTIQRGSLARGKANLVTSSRFTNKNKRGAFSITVTTGHLLVE